MLNDSSDWIYKVTYQVRLHLAPFQYSGGRPEARPCGLAASVHLSIKNLILVDLNFCNSFLKTFVKEEIWTGTFIRFT